MFGHSSIVRRKLIPDKSAGPYEFTDGCGMMSEDLARYELAEVQTTLSQWSTAVHAIPWYIFFVFKSTVRFKG